MTNLTNADDFDVEHATIDQRISDPTDVSDRVEVNRWTKKGDRLYVNEWVHKLDKYDFYLDLETGEVHCSNDAWEDKLTVEIDGDEVHVECDRWDDGSMIHELTVVLEGVEDDDSTETDGGQEVVADGGTDGSAHVDDETIEAALDDHEDRDHEDALTVADVRELLAWIQDGVEANWNQWVDNIEDGHAQVVHEDRDVVVLATGQHDAIREELQYYEGEVDIDEIAGSVVSQIHHSLARERCDHNWGTSYPIVIAKPDGLEDGQRYVEGVVNGLQRRGLSPAQAWNYYGCEIRGNSQSSWARHRDLDQSTVSESLDQARQKLP